MDSTLVMVLAGGRGTRLMPLTADRAKPAVPFGCRYRIIDFVLSNFVNSGFYKIKVLTQYKSQSLNTHISRAWRLSRVLGHYVESVPAQQRRGPQWYEGSADAIFQNLNLIDDEDPEHVAIFGGDHIYRMDVRQMVAYHEEKRAELTVAAIPVPIEQASAFGVITVDNDGRMVAFDEKPESPTAMPGRPDHALVSMGNYFFRRDALVREILADADDPDSSHDFGKDIVTGMCERDRPVYVYDFWKNDVPGQMERERGYWRDVGTIGSFWRTSMDLIEVHPVMNLYNRRWPIRTDYSEDPPAKFVHAHGERVGIATESLVSDGCIISGGRISRSLLAPRVRVNSFAQVENSILFENVDVGRHVRLRACIVDKHVQIPPGTEIGFDHDLDRTRGFTVTEEGLVVVPKGATIG